MHQVFSVKYIRRSLTELPDGRARARFLTAAYSPLSLSVGGGHPPPPPTWPDKTLWPTENPIDPPPPCRRVAAATLHQFPITQFQMPLHTHTHTHCAWPRHSTKMSNINFQSLLNLQIALSNYIGEMIVYLLLGLQNLYTPLSAASSVEFQEAMKNIMLALCWQMKFNKCLPEISFIYTYLQQFRISLLFVLETFLLLQLAAACSVINKLADSVYALFSHTHIPTIYDEKKECCSKVTQSTRGFFHLSALICQRLEWKLINWHEIFIE